MAISWLLYTNLQNKTLCWLLCMNLQNKTHYRLVTPFGRLQKSHHKYIVSKLGWKLSPIINERGREGWKKNVLGGKKIEKLTSRERGGGGIYKSIRHSRVGTKFRLKMTLLNFWIKWTQKGYFSTKKMEITIEFYIFKLI